MALPACARRESSNTGNKRRLIRRPAAPPKLAGLLRLCDAAAPSHMNSGKINQAVTLYQAILAGSEIARSDSRARTARLPQIARCGANRRDVRRYGGAGGLLCLPHPACHRSADDPAVHGPLARRLHRNREGAGAPGHRLRVARRRGDRAGAEGPRAAAAHEPGGKRPAQGRRGRLRDLRQIGRARRHQLRPEHQPSARPGRRARTHHPLARPGAGGARPPGAARAAAVLPRGTGGIGLDRAEGAGPAGAAAGQRHPPPHRLRGHRPQARARLHRGRDRSLARRRRP